MDVEILKHSIGGLIYNLSEVMARLGEDITDEDEELMITLIHRIAYLDATLHSYIEEQAGIITKQILLEVFGPRV